MTDKMIQGIEQYILDPLRSQGDLKRALLKEYIIDPERDLRDKVTWIETNIDKGEGEWEKCLEFSL